MPHITVEYSSNLRPRIDSKMLLQCVHRSAMESGLFRPGAIRSRGVQRDEYIVADEHEDNAFVHIVLRIGSGRDTETRKQLGNRIFSSASTFLHPLFEVIGLGLSVEVQVIDPDTSFRRNSLHERIEQASDETSKENQPERVEKQ